MISLIEALKNADIPVPRIQKHLELYAGDAITAIGLRNLKADTFSEIL